MANVFQQTLCPLCKLKIDRDQDDWTLTVDEDMNPMVLFHEKCYDEMPTRGEKTSKGKIMRECNNCGSRTYMLYEEDENYKVVCEGCDETHFLKANSMDRAMEKWSEMKLQADCEYCPLGWEERGYEGECYDCGCYVNEDVEWCKKTFNQRLIKAKEMEKY